MNIEVSARSVADAFNAVLTPTDRLSVGDQGGLRIGAVRHGNFWTFTARRYSSSRKRRYAKTISEFDVRSRVSGRRRCKSFTRSRRTTTSQCARFFIAKAREAIASAYQKCMRPSWAVPTPQP